MVGAQGLGKLNDSATVSFLFAHLAASARHVHLGHPGPVQVAWSDACCQLWRFVACMVLLLSRCVPTCLLAPRAPALNASQLLVGTSKTKQAVAFAVPVQAVGCFQDAEQQTFLAACMVLLSAWVGTSPLLCCECLTDCHVLYVIFRRCCHPCSTCVVSQRLNPCFHAVWLGDRHLWSPVLPVYRPCTDLPAHRCLPTVL